MSDSSSNDAGQGGTPPRPGPPRPGRGVPKRTIVGGAMLRPPDRAQGEGDDEGDGPTTLPRGQPPAKAPSTRGGVQGTRGFEAPPAPAAKAPPPPRNDLSSTVAFEAPMAAPTEAPKAAPGGPVQAEGRRERKKKALSSTIAFGAEEVAANLEAAKAQATSPQGSSPQATRAFGAIPSPADEPPKTQAFGAIPMAGSARPTPVPPAPGSATPTPIPPAPGAGGGPAAPGGAARRKNKSFSNTIAFGAEELDLARLEATGQSQKASEGRSSDLGSTMAFEGPSTVGAQDGAGSPAQPSKKSGLSSTMAFAPPTEANAAPGAAAPTPAQDDKPNLQSTLAFEAPSIPEPAPPAAGPGPAGPGPAGPGPAATSPRKQTMVGIAAPVAATGQASDPAAQAPSGGAGAGDGAAPAAAPYPGALQPSPGGQAPMLSTPDPSLASAADQGARHISTNPPPAPRSNGKVLAVVVAAALVVGAAVAVALYALGVV